MALPLTATSTSGQSAPNAGRDVRLRIEADRTSYRVGDSISLRISFTNTGSTPIRYVPLPAWDSSRLRVTDDSGRVVAPTSGPTAYSLISSIHSTLPGGVTQVQTWAPGSAWFDLRRWGYGALRPGRYSIEGYPRLAITGATPDTTLRSNRVMITVTP
jgi:hypothetical protein